MLNIESAEYTLLEGVPALRAMINGREAYLCDVNLPLLEAGYVYLISLTPGRQWEDALPVLTLPHIPGVNNRALPFPGVTDDPGVLALARRFVDTLKGEGGRPFAPGPMETP